MKIFNAQKATTTYNNGDKWEIVDTRTGEVVQTAKKANRAVALRDIYEEGTIKAQKEWAEFDAKQ